MTNWDDELVEQLKTLWIDGNLSASEIGGRLGGMSRNAVIGKAHRLGLPGRTTRTSTNPRPRAAPCVARARKMVACAKKQAAPAAPAPEPDLPPMGLSDADVIFGPGKGVTILKLTHETCRWPVGNPAMPDFVFCGHSVYKKTYCRGHARVAGRRYT
jgi:GcrA cell cycle regulator